MKLPIACLISMLVTACQVVPKHLDNIGQDNEGRFKRLVETSLPQQSADTSVNVMATNDSWWLNPTVSPKAHLLGTKKLQVGDLVHLHSLPFDELSGLYQITSEGNIDLPFIGSQRVANTSLVSAKAVIELALKVNGWFKTGVTQIQLSITEDAPISVVIRGSVFNPGQAVLNARSKTEIQNEIRQNTGSHTRSRNLLSALRAVGGVRPDANLRRVYLERSGLVYQFDLSSLLSGYQHPDVPDLQNHDKIYVASLGYEQSDLIRPSSITPPGMRVFMSNLTAPASSNAQSAIGSDSSRVPYGVSLIDVAVAANCMGGTQMANASRSIILVTKNYGSKKQLVIQRGIDELLIEASNSNINPYIMPNDAIACYDSKFTNFREVARGLGELISPFLLGRLL